MPSRINIGPENGPYVAINESSGNLQLEDNSGNVVAEWDETNAQWDFANNTLNNVDALNSNSVNTERLATNEGSIYDRENEDLSLINSYNCYFEENPSNTTSSSFSAVVEGGGFAVDFDTIPEAVSLYGRIRARFDSGDDDATAEFRPITQEAESFGTISLENVNVSVASSSSQRVDSGWQEVDSITSGTHVFRRAEARVDEGGEFSHVSTELPSLAFAWVLD